MGTGGLNTVRERVAAATQRSGRDAESVLLLAVSKGQPDEAVAELYEAGQRAFGENRPMGLRSRIDAALPADIDWHFIGNVQRRAIKIIAPSIVLLHSLGRTSVAEAWARLEDPPPVLIEVNIGEEPQKHGFAPDAVMEAADHIAGLGVAVHGLMIIPPRARVAEDNRKWFSALRDLGLRVRAEHPSAVELSMGMTDDFEVAIEEGASIVRVGRAIFEAATGTSNERSPED